MAIPRSAGALPFREANQRWITAALAMPLLKIRLSTVLFTFDRTLLAYGRRLDGGVDLVSGVASVPAGVASSWRSHSEVGGWGRIAWFVNGHLTVRRERSTSPYDSAFMIAVSSRVGVAMPFPHRVVINAWSVSRNAM
jgi:hypothetical protein